MFVSMEDLAQAEFASLPQKADQTKTPVGGIIDKIIRDSALVSPPSTDPAPIDGQACMGPPWAPSIPGFWKANQCVLGCPSGEAMTNSGRAHLPSGRSVLLRACRKTSFEDGMTAETSPCPPGLVRTAAGCKNPADLQSPGFAKTTIEPPFQPTGLNAVFVGALVVLGIAGYLWFASKE